MRRQSNSTRRSANPTPSEGKPRRGSGFEAKPSARLNRHRQADPWRRSSSSASAFVNAYGQGQIPCRINHGGVRHRLHWTTPPEELPYRPLLATFAEGLAESEHPFVFVAQTGFAEMLAAEGAADKAAEVAGDVATAFRRALLVRNDDVFRGVLRAVRQFSEAVGPALNPHLKALIVQIGKKALDRRLADEITETLQTLEVNGGPEVLKMIKAKVPTYTTALL